MTELEGTQEQINTTDNDKKSRRERERKFPESRKDSVKISKIDKEDPTYEDRSPWSKKLKASDQTRY